MKAEDAGRKAEGGRRKAEGGDLPLSAFPFPPSCISLSILLVGDATRPEFQDSRACLDHWGEVRSLRDADSAMAALTDGQVSPDVIVVAQAFPGEFSHEAIDGLRRAAPLARVLGLMGSLCEGEMRSGSPWPAVVRSYWHQWPARCNRQLCRLAQGQSCSWALPVTASDEERLLVDVGACLGNAGPHPSPLPNGERTGQVVIRSPSFAAAEWLSAACRDKQLATIWQRAGSFAHTEGATAGIFDGTDLCGEEFDELQRFIVALQPAPVVVLLSFPRIEDQRRALAAGAAAVFSKPIAVEDLFEIVKPQAVA